MTNQKQPEKNEPAGVSAVPLAEKPHKKAKKRSLLKAFALVATVGIGSTALYQVGTIESDIDFTVTDKTETTYDCGKDSAGYDKVCHDYLITTEKANGDIEVFENTDALYHEKFHPDTIQGQLKEGCTFKATVYGLRVDWANEHRNITNVKEISCPADGNTPASTAPADTDTADTVPKAFNDLLKPKTPEVEEKKWEIKSTRTSDVVEAPTTNTGSASQAPEAEEKAWSIKSTRKSDVEASTDATPSTDAQPPKVAPKAFSIKSTR